MANFEEAYELTLANEGGYFNHPNDRGNWTGKQIGKGVLAGTIKGITAWEVELWYKRPITAEDVKNFPESAIKEIYKRKYWNLIWGDRINNQKIANSLYDAAVNFGVTQAIKQAQRAAKFNNVNGKMSVEFLNTLNN